MTGLDRARRLLDQPPPDVIPGQIAAELPDRPARVCDVPQAEHTGPVRPYPCGPRCSAHSPWAQAGRPEPKPGPGLPKGAWSTPSPLNDSRVHDARAVASGKRRSTPTTYRAAQAAVNPRKDTA
ncbi:hypothetical protein [Streptomyces xantholiticus]|uniref:hypothetical protein n=1 Tax=Streptomyces xantholiticus TaxID=68285 RepID=UPI001671FF7A|nr:hypothetical protein [Streptomyces xantholiticus]GGW41108.1 hypothetical protein GCM10010381_27430 [Streptomyces xantholiticus]